MKRLLPFAALALFAVTSAGFAQSAAPSDGAAVHQRHAGNPHKAAMKMSRKLGLSPDQTARVEPILAARREKVQALRANTSLTDEQRHQQMHVIARDTKAQMAGVLTPDQAKQLREMHREKKAAKSGV